MDRRGGVGLRTGRSLIVHLDEPVTARCSRVPRPDGGAPARRASRCSTCSATGDSARLDLMVDRRVLIPRPETEQVVGWALDEVRRPRRPRPRGRRPRDRVGGDRPVAGRRAAGPTVWATDVSTDALDVARANSAASARGRRPGCESSKGAWWDALPDELRGRLDLVVSNPPYIGESEPLPPEVEHTNRASRSASGDEDGLAHVARWSVARGGWLAPGGVLVVEIAPATQAERVAGPRRSEPARCEQRSGSTPSGASAALRGAVRPRPCMVVRTHSWI